MAGLLPAIERAVFSPSLSLKRCVVSDELLSQLTAGLVAAVTVYGAVRAELMLLRHRIREAELHIAALRDAVSALRCTSVHESPPSEPPSCLL